jgi:methyl-accepting chemotaxis protein
MVVSCFLPPTPGGALSVAAPNLAGLMIIAVFNLFLPFFTLVYIVKRNRGFVDSLLALEKENAERLSKVQDLLQQVLTTGQILNRSGQELAANADQVGASASVINQQTADSIGNIKKVLQVIKENKDTLERNRGYTMETVRIIEGIVSNAQSGVAMSAEMDEMVDEFKGKLNQTFTTFRESGDQFISIQTIVETIDDISGQINLLSVNAAIEAARAGEHGRGFSIIAEAIQNLSNQTGTALSRIEEVIKNVSEQTDKIQKESKETGELFGKVLEVVLNVHGNIAAIAKRLNEKTPVLLKLTEFLQAQTQILAGVNNEVTGVYDFVVNTDQQVRELLTVIDGVKKSVGDINSAATGLSTLFKSLTTQEEPE